MLKQAIIILFDCPISNR